ncbi:hypothetical protein [Sorangium sp. So ce176]|uniref:hypothetical protein n=1 Tax=Sorangium sp. So ce176 TaxID=3133286 RepID=UPI003F5ED23E
MTEYDTLRTQVTPRDLRIARRLARRLDPIGGFLLYGFLWIYVSVAVAVFAARAVGSVLSSTGSMALPLALFVLAYMVYPIWVWRRRRSARRLFRDGTFVDATVDKVRHSYMGRGRWRAPVTLVNLQVTLDGKERYPGLSLFGHIERLERGDVLPVLSVPGYKHCAAFPGRGELVVAQQHFFPEQGEGGPRRRRGAAHALIARRGDEHLGR